MTSIKLLKLTVPWRQFAMTSISTAAEPRSRPVYRGPADARMSVQNTLYLVFGA
jgi:hypothetical protein